MGKKRVIQPTSDSEEEDVPLSKRTKVEEEQVSLPALDGMNVDPALLTLKPNDNSSDAPLADIAALTTPLEPAPHHGFSTSDEDMPMADRIAPATEPVKEKKSSKGGAAARKKKSPKKNNGPPDVSTAESTEDQKPAVDESSSDEDGQPLAEQIKPKSKAKPAKAKKPAAKKKQPNSNEENESDADVPLASTSKAKPPPKPKAKKEKAAAKKIAKKEEPNDDDALLADGAAGSGTGEEEDYKWWENVDEADDSVKWKTLQHAGVIFPPEYEPLPDHVKLHYNGRPVDLPPEAEEVALFFAAMCKTDHAEKPVFVENFFKDFKTVLDEYPPNDGTKIKEFAKCDWEPMYNYCEVEREKKKQLTKKEKDAIKKEKDKLEEPYKFAILDGRKEKVGNFRIEPPGLFRGRGAHPKTGMLKKRVQPEQVTINIGKEADVPEPPEGHSWGKVQHDNTVSWLAMWKENINGATKYVFLAAGSSLKGQSDMKKFEKARNLKDHIDRIRRDYNDDLTDKAMVTRQRATAVYLIDQYALRNGNEKGEDEADTVGCCSLKCSNITLTPPDEVLFDFLGKDSIRFLQTFKVIPQVFKNLRIFKKEPKTEDDLLFDRLTTQVVNTYLKEYMDGLTAKVFRTYNASWTFQEQLDKLTEDDMSVADKILAYNRANRLVAVLCNHQRAVPKTHGQQMEKMDDKLKAHLYQRRKMRFALLTAVGDKGRKKYSEYEDGEEELDDEWIAKHEEDLRDEKKAKANKRFEKEGVKEGEEESESEAEAKPAPKKGKKAKKGADDDEAEEEAPAKAKGKKKKRWTKADLDKVLKAADDEFEQNRKDTETEEVVVSKYKDNPDKIIADIEKQDLKIANFRTTMTDKSEGKDVSLTTSKINYIDPRLTVAWCKKHEVPLEKMFSKTMREKFTWAMNAPADFRF